MYLKDMLLLEILAIFKYRIPCPLLLDKPVIQNPDIFPTALK